MNLTEVGYGQSIISEAKCEHRMTSGQLIHKYKQGFVKLVGTPNGILSSAIHNRKF